eukprot:1162065-Pelagomonas_calceolata.AAC.4
MHAAGAAKTGLCASTTLHELTFPNSKATRKLQDATANAANQLNIIRALGLARGLEQLHIAKLCKLHFDVQPRQHAPAVITARKLHIICLCQRLWQPFCS